MRKLLLFPLALLATAGCQEAATAPEEALTSASPTPPALAVTRWTEFTVIDVEGNQEFVPCANDGAGEVLTFHGFYNGQQEWLLTPSGNVVVRAGLIYDPLPAVTLTGPSGDTWSLASGQASLNPGEFKFLANGTFIIHGTGSEHWINQDGERLHLQWVTKFHLTPGGTWIHFYDYKPHCS